MIVLDFSRSSSCCRRFDRCCARGTRKRRGIEVTAYDGVADAVHWQRLERALAAAKPEIVIAESFPLEDAAAAHRRIEAGHVLGKIVLGIR